MCVCECECVCVCVCVFVFVCVSEYVCVYARARARECVYDFACASLCVAYACVCVWGGGGSFFVRARVCFCLSVCLSVCLCAKMSVCLCALFADKVFSSETLSPCSPPNTKVQLPVPSLSVARPAAAAFRVNFSGEILARSKIPRGAGTETEASTRWLLQQEGRLMIYDIITESYHCVRHFCAYMSAVISIHYTGSNFIICFAVVVGWLVFVCVMVYMQFY